VGAVTEDIQGNSRIMAAKKVWRSSKNN